jgi:F420-non-reducing hydrogenase small subunit
MPKLKIAAYWAAACGGCDTALLDLHDKILVLAAAADILFWPIALDFKYRDVEAMPDGHIDVTLLSGAIRNEENEHVAKLLRQKTKTLVAFGSCAHLGGIPGLANLFNRDQIFDCVYRDSPSLEAANGHGRVVPHTRTKVPEGELTLPEFYNTVRTVDQTIPVDYYVPGCPPIPKQIWAVVSAIIAGNLPPRGSVLGASDRTQCDDCKRTKHEKKVKAFRRIATAQPDPETCFLEQGFLCMGPATRAGCDSRCQNSGVGCRGCYGPPPGVIDQGAKALSAIASIVECEDEEEAKQVMGAIPDPLRTFNRFGIPASLLRRRAL